MYNIPQEINPEALTFKKYFSTAIIRDKHVAKILFTTNYGFFMQDSLKQYKFDISNSVFLYSLLAYFDNEDTFMWEISLAYISQKEVLNSLYNFFAKIDDVFSLESLARNKNIGLDTMHKLAQCRGSGSFINIFLSMNPSVPKDIISLAIANKHAKRFFNV